MKWKMFLKLLHAVDDTAQYHPKKGKVVVAVAYSRIALYKVGRREDSS